LVEECKRVPLKSGEELVVKRMVPPEESYQDRLVDFFPYTGSAWDQELIRRAEGKLVEVSRDFFFVGEIGDQLVGYIWYTMPLDLTEVSTMGFVYTDPGHRRKGIATNLLEVALEDCLNRSGVPSATYLSTEMDNPVHGLYARFGFRDHRMRRKEVVMRLARPSEEEFESHYFRWEGQASIREPHRGDLPRFEALFNRSGWVIKDLAHGVLGQAPYEKQFVWTLNALESGHSCSLVLENPRKRVVGWAMLTFHSQAEGWEEDWALLDFLVCPEYGAQAQELVDQTIQRSRGVTLRSYAAQQDREKVEVLNRFGFRLDCDMRMGVNGRETAIGIYDRRPTP